MPYTNYTSKEVASRGETIYKREIRDKVEPKHKGKFLVIDIETGEYKMNTDDLAATKRLLAKRPDAAIYGLQIGSSTAYRIGASAIPENYGQPRVNAPNSPLQARPELIRGVNHRLIFQDGSPFADDPEDAVWRLGDIG